MRRTVLAAILLLIVAVHGGLLWIYHEPAPKRLWGDQERYLRQATELREGAQVDNDPLWPTLYPRFVCGVLAVTGGSILALQLIQTLLLLLTSLLLHDLARRAGAPAGAALAAALLMLLYPPLAAFAHYLWPEVLHLALAACAVSILVRHPTSWPWLVLFGIVVGLALLTKYLLWPFVPLMLVPILLARDRRGGAWRAVMVLIVIGLTVAPTLVTARARNGVTGVVASARFNLWVGLNERSRQTFVDPIVDREYDRWKRSEASCSERAERLSRETRKLLRERGLRSVLLAQLGRQYFRLLDKDSFLTDQLPGGVLAHREVGYRQTPRWLAAGLRGLSYTLYTAMLIAAPLGLVLYRPRRSRWLWLVAAFLVYSGLLFLLVHVKTRYRVQLLPLLCLFAGMGFHGLAAWRAGGAFAKQGHRLGAWIAALILAGMLLIFAFLGPYLV